MSALASRWRPQFSRIDCNDFWEMARLLPKPWPIGARRTYMRVYWTQWGRLPTQQEAAQDWGLKSTATAGEFIRDVKRWEDPFWTNDESPRQLFSSMQAAAK